MQSVNGPEKEEYISRPYRDGDETALVRLYNDITARSRTLEQFRWEWLDTPEGRGSMWIIEEVETRKIVGHHGLIPMRFRFFDRSIMAGKTENTMVHPKYRGRVRYFSFETTFLDQAREIYGLLFTNMARGKPGRIRKGLGYTDIGNYEDYVKVCSKEALDQIAVARVHRAVKGRILQQLLSWMMKAVNFLVFGLLFGRNVKVDSAIDWKHVKDIAEVAEELDRLWERSKDRFGLTVNRDPRFLKWRLFENPNTHYDFHVARRGGELIGYAAYEQVRESTVWLVDLVADGNDVQLLETLLGSFIQRLNDEGVVVVWLPTLRARTTVTRALRRNGFKSFSAVHDLWHRISGKEISKLMVKVLDDELDSEDALNPDCWYYTSILEEGRRRGDGEDSIAE